ncbi:hypothetical protein CKG00_18115 [Morganella morganii]|uniref:Uncharacterized protein n=1 Tax=Morganella morganii TaxID=582 RepID=A0A433ZQ71_MORMO|nr:hypothetical protein [Morganella morganii]RUT64277.1 hypothetical protein CKG00_18115 [Morganella morganii]
MEPTEFEKWCAGELGHTFGYIVNKRRKDFFGITGYNLSEIEIRYRAYMAGVRSRLPYQTQPPEE